MLYNYTDKCLSDFLGGVSLKKRSTKKREREKPLQYNRGRINDLRINSVFPLQGLSHKYCNCPMIEKGKALRDISRFLVSTESLNLSAS